ncbi:MAG: 3-isopropylmalate dehydrogenase, partial [Elusimicrobia bacterium]|nr:3-isopropylmalate dehydrogenase [Elusimicrobiota bacterium]
MKNFKVAVIAGDGIGPEVIREGRKVLSKVAPQLQSKLQFSEYDLGAAQYLKTKEAMPESVFKELAGSDAIYLGAVGDPKVPPGILEREILLKIRFELDLYINLRPCILYEGAFTPLKNKGPQDIHFVVVRENTESVYAGLGGVFRKGTSEEVAIQEDINTRKGVERCVRFAYDYCQKRNHKKVLTLVDKANVLTHAHQLWRRAFAEVGRDYPDVRTNATYVDAAGMDFVRKPEIFDTLVTNNIFGDILTDLGAIISGGLGLASSANLNPSRKEGGASALFEPVHGSAPDIAGKGLANPLAAILA